MFEVLLWDTVTNAIQYDSHPLDYDFQNFIEPTVFTFDDESIMLTNAGLRNGTGNYLGEYFQYHISDGWTKVQSSPALLNGIGLNGIYLLNNPLMNGFDKMNTCIM